MSTNYTPSLSDTDLRRVLRGLHRIHEAGLQTAFHEDLAQRLRDAEDLDHCALGRRLYAEGLAREASQLLRIPVKRCERVATDAILATRQTIIIDCILDYLREIDQAAGRSARKESDDPMLAAIQSGNYDRMRAVCMSELNAATGYMTAADFEHGTENDSVPTGSNATKRLARREKLNIKVGG